MNKQFASLFFLFISIASSFGQSLQFNTKISENKITSFSNQKLILIDFWATWCGPCVAATKQLEIFQEENKSKIFIFSVSDQSESIVEKFLIRNPNNLMVALDTEKKYFDKYDVKSRPYAVLLDIKGNLLWKGHPADLNQKKFDAFYEKHKNEQSLSIDDLVAFSNNNKKNEIVYNKVNFELKKTNEQESSFEIVDNKVSYVGKLKNLVCLLKNKTIFGIELDNTQNYNLELVCDIEEWKKPELILEKLSDKFDLKIEEIEKVQFGNEILVDNKKMLWKTNEIVWEESDVNYIIGSEKITADNVSIKEMARILSVATNKNYIYLGNDSNLYDWEFQYIYEDLMLEELESTFGIKVKKTNAPQQITKITSN